MSYIAETLGIGLTQTKKAISDLVQAGVIIKTKRDKVRGNYNKYLIRRAKIDFKTGKNENTSIYTKTDVNVQNSTEKHAENELFKKTHSDHFIITDKKEQIKQQTCLGGNVYLGDDLILKEYAEKHGAKNISAYISKLKETGSAAKIIKEFKHKKNATQKALCSIQRTNEIIKQYREYKFTAVNPDESLEWVKLREKIKALQESKASTKLIV